MKTLEQIACLYYNYYSKGATTSGAYIKTIGVLVFLLIILIVDLFIIIDIEYVLHFNGGSKYIYTTSFITSLFIFFFLLLPEKKIREVEYPVNKVERGKRILLVTTILIILSLPVILLSKYRF